MFKKLQSALLTTLLLCTAWVASAQNRTATGTVSDNIGPVIGAGVLTLSMRHPLLFNQSSVSMR